MHIIPVIDLLNGVCVHAKKGERSRYLPIVSKLTKSSQPLDIVKAFMDIYPFKTLYIADLNAIQSLENTGAIHSSVIDRIQQAFPMLTIWIDAAINTDTQVSHWSRPNTKIVLGSESFTSIEQYISFTKKLKEPYTLSLDFLAQGYAGPQTLLDEPAHWPADIIAMTLAKVGADTGIDTNTIKTITAKNSHHAIYAAGGIRHSGDLTQLKALEVKGCLLASALHSKQISQKDLRAFTS